MGADVSCLLVLCPGSLHTLHTCIRLLHKWQWAFSFKMSRNVIILIKCDVCIRSTFCALRVGFNTEVCGNSDWDQTKRARVAYRILYLNSTDMKIKLLPYILNLVPLAYNFRDGSYSELKQTYPVVLGDCHWTPATLFGKIILLSCLDTPIYCYSCNNIASRQILVHATETMKPYVATFSP